MAAVQVSFRLKTGDDFTGYRGPYLFRNGRYVTICDLGKLSKLQRVMENFYGAELEDGPGKVHTNDVGGSAAPVSGGVRPDGSGPAPQAADGRGGAAGDALLGAGSVPSGNGQSDARDDGRQEFANRLLKAVKALNPKLDDHWTSDGRPRVDAVEKLYGNGSVTRADVERVAPGYTRPTVT